jgi:xylulose-5-phosphate/fructose-6-phosphate phosphoketolase
MPRRMEANLRAVDCQPAGRIHLYDNSLVERPLMAVGVKLMLPVLRAGSVGQNFIKAHLSRRNNIVDLDTIYISGPGHGGQAAAGNT